MEESEHLKINEATWDKWAASLDGKGFRYEYLRKCQRSVVSLLDVKENSRVLDIGCGTGWALGQIANLVDGKGSFYGVDLSAKMVEKAKENFAGRTQFQFIKATADAIPLDDNSFDIIICTNSFHHYYNPGNALKEMYRLLKVTGKVYILDPTIDAWILQLITRIVNFFEAGHVKLHSTREFSDLILNAGLKYEGSIKVAMQQKVHIGQK